VVTIGDVLVGTDKAQLRSGGLQGVDKLACLLSRLPQCHTLFEGFTDSTVGKSHNQALSGHRAVLSNDCGSITPRWSVGAVGPAR
jgi:outer membrane protein OmpA-like peptidoglycan-associated protein